MFVCFRCCIGQQKCRNHVALECNVSLRVGKGPVGWLDCYGCQAREPRNDDYLRYVHAIFI